MMILKLRMLLGQLLQFAMERIITREIDQVNLTDLLTDGLLQ